ncbi:S28 family serine protease [Streptomyces sp. VRA16 Mangrove soil]|uniref:S28 family serine protease n=1 Tax=Streptomyces sp. VRA16 Mangrove soil TaxID=2817434 RepID=UPI001A9EA978|nr:S28 family serine protease [Streptomyces sp. VRA16 Mangrove soil]MBO1330633.1 aminopeptidase [Streptomyces sp. VRA16 Mangrove soil]
MRLRAIPTLLLSAALTAGALAATAAPAGAATASAQASFEDQLRALPGITVTGVSDKEGFPLYALTITQPIDHTDPRSGTFQQRFTIWQKSTAKPVVVYTGGYGLSSSTREPTTILDANQLSVEHRFFGPSVPAGGTPWAKMTVQQEAADEHAIVQAVRPLYEKSSKWLATGGSKGGMTATYHYRFYPRDYDGVVAYVAPNDANNNDDSTYERFFRTVGTAECRDALAAVQREMLVRRDALLPKFEQTAKDEGYTFTRTLGTTDRAYEFAVLDQVWNFWQSGSVDDCPTVPDARTVSDDELYQWSLDHGLSVYEDSSLGANGSGPYYRQAAAQLGWADLKFKNLKGVRHYPDIYQPNSVLPADMRTTYDGTVIKGVDKWVRTESQRMLFVYGQNDPWSAEQFTPSRHDSYKYVVPKSNHGARISALPTDEKDAATATIKRWAGVR